MASFNQVILMGNLTRDPALKFLPSQMAVAEFGLAVNRKFRTQSGEDREEVTFVDVTAFGKTGETINQYFTKGKPIMVVGRLKFDSWEDKNGGGKRSKLTVVADTFQFVGGDNRQGGQQPHDDVGYEAPPARRGPQSRGPARGPSYHEGDAPHADPAPDVDPDSIPF